MTTPSTIVVTGAQSQPGSSAQTRNAASRGTGGSSSSQQRQSKSSGISHSAVITPSAPGITNTKVEVAVRSSHSMLADSTGISSEELVNQIQAFMEKNKAVEVTFIWVLMSLISFWTAFPIEWLFFLYFTLTIFGQAYELGATVFSLLIVIIIVADAGIWYFVPYKVTSFVSTLVVNTFLVCGIHDLTFSLDAENLSGWLFVGTMIGIRLTLWSVSNSNAFASTTHFFVSSVNSSDVGDAVTSSIFREPPEFMAPVAAHCTSFGICYVIWKLCFIVYRNFDLISSFLGLLLPDAPILSISELTETSFKVSWTISRASTVSSTASSINSKKTSATRTPQASQSTDIKRFVIEVNGVIIGETSNQDSSVVVTGLNSDSKYRVKVWSVAEMKVRTPSNSALVRTLKSSSPPPTTTAAEATPSTCEEPNTQAELQPSKNSEDSNASSEPTASIPSDSSTIESTPHDKPDTTAAEVAHLIQQEIVRVTKEIASLDMQRAEISRTIVEAQAQHSKAEAELQAELDLLRETKRKQEPSRLELKTRLKTLEDAKSTLEARKAKMERDIKLGRTAIESKKSQQIKLAEELDRLHGLIKETNEGKQRVIESTAAKKKELETTIAEKKRQIQEIELAISKKRTSLESTMAKIREREEEAAALMEEAKQREEQAAALASGKSSLIDVPSKDRFSPPPGLDVKPPSKEILQNNEAIQFELIQFHKLLQALQVEHQALQGLLLEESRAKLKLMTELSKARQDANTLMRQLSNKPPLPAPKMAPTSQYLNGRLSGLDSLFNSKHTGPSPNIRKSALGFGTW